MHASELADQISRSPATDGEALPSVHEALGDIDAAARSYATKERLWAPGGGLLCWECKRPSLWHVSLHCQGCRDAVIDRTAKERREARRMHDEEHRWRGITWNMAEDSRLNQELAVTLLNEARKLPSATQERMELLNSVFDKRFGADRPQKKTFTYEPDR